MKQYNWTTDKGAKVQVDVIEATINDTLASDGWGLTYSEKQIASFALNGTKYEARFTRHQGKAAIEFRFQGKKALVLIPQDIASQIWAKEMAAANADLDAEMKHAEHYNKVKQAMAE